jgi:cytoskeleton protein RodZ
MLSPPRRAVPLELFPDRRPRRESVLESGVETAPTPTSPRKAVFQFKQRSWVDVRDASGKRLLQRSFPPGRRVEIEGEPPFRVFLGRASAVQVEYMGEIVQHDTNSGRLYARFELGVPSG